MVFCQTGGGGSPGGGKKPNCFFEKSIFQRVSRIILGPPKHVLHLVLIDYDISTAINIALKLACLGKFMAIIEAIIKAKKKIDLEMGPSEKLVFLNQRKVGKQAATG